MEGYASLAGKALALAVSSGNTGGSTATSDSCAGIMSPAAAALTPGFFHKQHEYAEVTQTFFPEVTDSLPERVNLRVSWYMLAEQGRL